MAGALSCRDIRGPCSFDFKRLKVKIARPVLATPKLSSYAKMAFNYGPAKLRDSTDSIRFESDGPIRKFQIAAPATFAVVP